MFMLYRSFLQKHGKPITEQDTNFVFKAVDKDGDINTINKEGSRITVKSAYKESAYGELLVIRN